MFMLLGSSQLVSLHMVSNNLFFRLINYKSWKEFKKMRPVLGKLNFWQNTIVQMFGF